MMEILAIWELGILTILLIVGVVLWVVKEVHDYRTDPDKPIHDYMKWWGNEWGACSREELEELKKILKEFEDKHSETDKCSE